MPDPFEKQIRKEKLQEELFKTQCTNAAEQLASEIRTDNTPLHNMIDNMLSRNDLRWITYAKNEYVPFKDYPAKYSEQFETLTKCYERYPENSSERYQLNKKFDRLSKYLKISGTIVANVDDNNYRINNNFALIVTRNK